jgi:hypothetical protein
MRKYSNLIQIGIVGLMAIGIIWYFAKWPTEIGYFWSNWLELYGWTALIFSILAFLYGIKWWLTGNGLIFFFLWATHRSWDGENSTFFMSCIVVLVFAFMIDWIGPDIWSLGQKRTKHRKRVI